MRIIIADDHDLVLAGFSNYLAKQFPHMEILVAKNSKELEQLLQNYTVDLLFQDIKFGKEDARDFVGKLKAQYPLLKIIMISTLADPLIVENIIKKGIDGYVLKSDPNDQIIAAIEAVQHNEVFVSKGLKNIMHTHSLKKTSKIELTPREQEVLRLILEEKTMKEIAQELFVSEKTVENHRSNIMVKLQVRNTAGLVKKAILDGLL